MHSDREVVYELVRNDSSSFGAQRYKARSYELHFHRNIEIYGVLQGEVDVTVVGEKRTLRAGEIAIINCMELHEYTVNGEAEAFHLHIGTMYLSIFDALYKQSQLPRWLTDADYNKKIIAKIEPFFKKSELFSLRIYGICNGLFADIVERYGVVAIGSSSQSRDIVEQVIQYIYENFASDITLKSLANQFNISPKALSRKLSHYIGIDLRTFINELRMQKAMEILSDPNNTKTKKEVAEQCGFKTIETFYRLYGKSVKTRI